MPNITKRGVDLLVSTLVKWIATTGFQPQKDAQVNLIICPTMSKKYCNVVNIAHIFRNYCLYRDISRMSSKSCGEKRELETRRWDAFLNIVSLKVVRDVGSMDSLKGNLERPGRCEDYNGVSEKIPSSSGLRWKSSVGHFGPTKKS